MSQWQVSCRVHAFLDELETVRLSKLCITLGSLKMEIPKLLKRKYSRKEVKVQFTFEPLWHIYLERQIKSLLLLK